MGTNSPESVEQRPGTRRPLAKALQSSTARTRGELIYPTTQTGNGGEAAPTARRGGFISPLAACSRPSHLSDGSGNSYSSRTQMNSPVPSTALYCGYPMPHPPPSGSTLGSPRASAEVC